MSQLRQVKRIISILIYDDDDIDVIVPEELTNEEIVQALKDASKFFEDRASKLAPVMCMTCEGSGTVRDKETNLTHMCLICGGLGKIV